MTQPTLYSCTNSPSLKTKLVFFEKDGKTVKRVVKVQFENGLWKTSDPAEIARMDQLIAENPHISQVIKKLDREAALSVARENIARQKMQNTVARGGTNSEALKRQHSYAQAYNEALAETGSPEIAQQFVEQLRNEENYNIPVSTVNPDGSVQGDDTPNGGFQAGAKGKEADPEADVTAAVPESTEEQQKQDAERDAENAPAPSMRNPFQQAADKKD